MLPQREWDLQRFLKIATSGLLQPAVQRKKQRLYAEQQAARAANGNDDEQEEGMEDDA
jgi:hypothetical protein